jgi:hypothetical protein
VGSSTGAIQLMTPRQEVLAEQRIGPAGATLLYRLVLLVARSRNFPPPLGFEQWDESAVTETAHDFLVGERGRKRIADIAIRSVDEASFERIMEAAVVNHLREMSRRTDMGKLILRVSEILTDSDEFKRTDGRPARWALTDGPTAPSIIPDSHLAAALVDLPVTVPSWSSERRDAPLADRASFTRLLRMVLSAADGSLTAADIARAAATRLDHRRTPLSIELDVLERVAERSGRQDPAALASSAMRATQIFNELDDRGRILIACYGQPVRELGDLLALGRSQAALLQQRVIVRLREELEEDEDPDQTIAELRKLCECWLTDRTRTPGATFTHDVGIMGNDDAGRSSG